MYWVLVTEFKGKLKEIGSLWDVGTPGNLQENLVGMYLVAFSSRSSLEYHERRGVVWEA